MAQAPSYIRGCFFLFGGRWVFRLFKRCPPWALAGPALAVRAPRLARWWFRASRGIGPLSVPRSRLGLRRGPRLCCYVFYGGGPLLGGCARRALVVAPRLRLPGCGAGWRSRGLRSAVVVAAALGGPGGSSAPGAVGIGLLHAPARSLAPGPPAWRLTAGARKASCKCRPGQEVPGGCPVPECGLCA